MEMEEQKDENIETNLKALENLFAFAQKVDETGTFFNVPQPKENFVGRPNEFEFLQEHLAPKITEDSKICIVHGPPGIGKTELVKQYANTYWCDEGQNVIWIDARTSETITDAITHISRLIGIDENKKFGGKKSIFELSNDLDEHFSGKTRLYVFDHLQSYYTIQFFMTQFAQVLHCPPKVLITTYHRDWPLQVGVQFLELPAFNIQEACCFVKLALQIEDTEHDEEVATMCENLGNFPQPLAQAVAFIKSKRTKEGASNKKYTVAEFLDDFENNEEEKLKFFELRDF